MARKPKFTVNNGSRIEVSFGSFTGTAGVVTRDGQTEVAFFGRKSDVEAGSTGRIGDKQYRVDKVERSSEVRNGKGPEGMIRLTVTAVTE